jgi:tetratricopeptide (TPR) repeat protein
MTESIFKKAVDEAKNRNYDRAADLFTLSLNQQSNNYAGYLNRGTIRLSLKAFEDAVLDFSTAISLEPYEITAYYNRFIAHYRIGNKVQALKDLYIALSLSYTKRG